MLGVPLLREGDPIGVIALARQRVEAFTERQIDLVRTFADQAVIAMENARLITETREALEQQTATAEVLQVINSSPGDLAPVFDAMLEKATHVCGAEAGVLCTYDGERYWPVAQRGFDDFPMDPIHAHPDTGIGRIARGEKTVHILDSASGEAYQSGDPGRRAIVQRGARTQLTAALRREDKLLGSFTLRRREVRAFNDKQIALLESFAAQAVIAMENARLITETREALDQQKASAEILSVISTSVADAQPVFDKILESCKHLFGGDELDVLLVDDEGLLQVAAYVGKARDAVLATFPAPVDIAPAGRAIRERRVAHYPDVLNNPDTPRVLRRMGEIVGYHSVAFAPMVWENRGIGAVGVARSRGAFTDRELAILQSFADQAVIAMQNARLITETREARDDAQAALRDLKAAQANLVQAEKMASLGQLTAGIAHEIKNPLNFVNNFAALSVELLDELKETTAPAVATLGENKRAEVDETIELLTGNLEKIAEHGKRADGIVKSMLEHSRGTSGERREVDLNNLVEEALNLAYHGARAQDQSFNITLERDFADGIAPIELVPQDITRVCLNLCSNGFYAAAKREKEGSDPKFKPVLKVATRDLGDAVEIRVRDNGTGIPPEIKDKLFQPFFTTKPTGEGTGLGLSISYDIVTQQHGGTIEVDSQVGEFTEVTIRLPRTQPTAAH